MNDQLADEQKALEAWSTDQCIHRTQPFIARLDGRAFSTYTALLDKPYSTAVANSMRETAKHLCIGICHETGILDE